MDIEEDNDVVKAYLTLIDNLEQMQMFVKGRNFDCYSIIQQQLINCYNQMDMIIAWETSHSSFLALCQQKYQLNMLIEMTEKLIEKESKFNNFKIELPENFSEQHIEQHTEPKAKLENIIAATAEAPKVKGFRDVVGLHNVKKELKSLILLPKTQPQLFHHRRICNSILLYGPPGTGKTRLAHALAAEADADFHCISAGDILSHYVGQTEKTIKILFQNLKINCRFAVLFIDEIDAFCRKRTENEQEYTRRIKTELMCQMSALEECKNIIVIGATNCPWELDTAILRRLQKRIYVPLPDQCERLEFFRFFTNNILFEDSSIDWTLLVEKTIGYSGSDLSDIVQSAMTIPLNELEDTKIWKCCADGFYEPVLAEQDFSNVICSELRDLPSNSVRARKVQLNDLLIAADSVKSTVTENDIKKYEVFNRI